MSSYFDDLLGETKATDASKKNSSYFDSLLEDSAPAYVQPESIISVPESHADAGIFKAQSFVSPSDSLMESIRLGKVKIQSKDPIATAYDNAPDKRKYKQTLTNTQLQTLKELRPESKYIGSLSIYDTNVSAIPLGGKTTIGPPKDFNIFDTIKAKQNEYGYEFLGPALYKIGENIDKNKILGTGAALVNGFFSPLNFAASQISGDMAHPGNLYDPGNLFNKAISAPFEASVGIISAMAITGGMEKQDAEDLAIITASVLPFAKNFRKTNPGKDISTYRDMANQIFTKTRDMTSEGKSLYRGGAKELHPDVSGLPYSFMARFNDAASKGDVVAMRGILEEGRAYKKENPKPETDNGAKPETDNGAKTGNEMGNSGTDLVNKYRNDISEAKKTANNPKAPETETAIAKIVLEQFQEDTKEVAKTIKNDAGETIVNVEVVPYPDGTFASSATVGLDPAYDITTPMTGEFDTQEKAIQAAVQTAQEMAIENESPIARDIEAQTIAEAETAKVAETIPEIAVPEETKAITETLPEPKPDESDRKQNLVANIEQMYIDKGLPQNSAIKSNSEMLAGVIMNGGYHEILHPDNKKSREIFEKVTEVKLPNTLSGTKEAVKAKNWGVRIAPVFKDSGVDVKKTIAETEKNDTIEPTNPTAYGTRPKEVSDAGDVGLGTDQGSGTEPNGKGVRGEGDAGAQQPRNGSNVDEAPSEGKGVGKKTRAKTNEEVKSLVTSKNFSADPKDYTDGEKTLMLQYTGAGGKESEGATGRGLLDEYYTPKAIVQSMWDIASKIIPNGKAFEPSTGIGRFFENAPEGFSLHGMELDKLSGTIVQVLHPGAKVKIGDFQSLFVTDNGKKIPITESYDVVIGNPPYGERAGLYKGLGEEKLIGKWDEYFIKRGVDLLKKDGVLVFIVPSAFLRTGKTNGKVSLPANVSLVDAYRLPEGMFEDTTIGTDIIVLQKNGAKNQNNMENDNFFKENPDKVLGGIIDRKNRFGKMEEVVVGTKEDAIKMLKEQIGQIKDKDANRITEPTPERKESAAENKVEVFPIAEGIFKGEVQAIVTEGPDKGKVAIASTEGEAREKIKRPAEDKPKVPAVPKPKTEPRKPRTKKEPEKNLNVSGIKTVESQYINEGYSTDSELEIFGAQERDGSIPESKIKASWKPYLNYQRGKYYHDINYFSGDIRKKLEDLELDKADMGKDVYEIQKEGLMSILPKSKKYEDIFFNPLDRFVANETTANTKMNGEPSTVMDDFVNWVDKFPRGLLARGVENYDIVRYVRGDRARQGTKDIMGSIKEESKRVFDQFMKTVLDPATQEKIHARYDREKNSYVRPDYRNIPMAIKGMASEFNGKPFNLTKTQKDAIGFLVNKGMGLIAHGVGVGKTHSLLVATVANMQKGWTKRPVFIVPKSTMRMWESTMKSMFPGIKVNMLEGLQSGVLKKWQAKGEPSEWIEDGSVSFISHEGILKLRFTPEELQDLTKDLTDALETASGTEREREKTRGDIDEVVGKASKDAEIFISELGFDHISVDEVHNFRKSFTAAKVEKDDGGDEKNRRFGNVQAGTPSAKAQKLFVISQHVQKNNGGRNVFLASATPFENQPTEVYNILSLMARERLKEMGLFNMNDFFSTFSNFKSETVLNTAGTDTKEREIMMGFNNLPELKSLLKEFRDKQEDPTLVRPEKKVMTPQLPMSELQKDVKEAIIDAYNEGLPGADLVAIGQFKSNSVSPYFTKYGGIPKNAVEFVKNSPKIEYAMEALRTIKNDPKTKDRSNFLYIGNEGIVFTRTYVDYLVNDVGYKPSEVAVITGKTKENNRNSIMNKFNSGKVKVLIGGTPTKEGINLQENAYMTINLSLGWNPTEWIQVEGRGWRQGNNLGHILMIYPLVEDSGDIFLFQKFLEKSSRINDMDSDEGLTFDTGEMDAGEKKMMLITDPVAKARMAITFERGKLSGKENYLKGEINELENKVRDSETAKVRVAGSEERIEGYRVSMKKLEDMGLAVGNSSYKYYSDSIESENKNLRDLKRKSEAIKKNLEKLGMDPKVKIAESEAELEKITGEILAIEGTFESKVDQFERELVENRKKTKTLSQHIAEISKENSTLRVRSKEELKAEKERLTKEVEAKNKEAETGRMGRFAKRHPQKESKGPDAYVIPEKITEVKAAKTTEEFKGRIEQLNKFAMGRGIMRRFGKLSKKDAAGQFYRKGVDRVTTLGEVRIRKDIPIDDAVYMEVLAHELGHALEYHVTGTTNKNTYDVFGKGLSQDVKDTLHDELVKNTIEIVGLQEYEAKNEYYGQHTELLARFLQRHFTEPMKLETVAPTASETFLKNAVNSPAISEYLEAVNGTIDSLQLKFPGSLNFVQDRKQAFQRLLGERAGNRAYNTIIRRNALQARSKSVFEKELKAKFKDIKNIEGVFRAIEATLKTEGGVPVFGTRDFKFVSDLAVIEHEDAGWKISKDENGLPIQDDKGSTKMEIDRYTAEEGKRIFDGLSPVEQEFVKDFTAIKDEAKDFVNREIIKDAYGIQSDVEGWIHHFWEDSFFGTGKTKFKTRKAAAAKHRTGSEGYKENAQEALYKSLTELEGAKIFNDWLNEFIPTVTKPLAEGQQPDPGWMEVTGDFVKGFLKEGDVKEYRITDKGVFKVRRARYQIPKEIYMRFGKIADLTEEATTSYAVLELIANAWQVNVLAHPGTAVTNAIGGGLQFSLKMFTDLYKSILTGDASIISQDVTALIKSLTNWNDVPTWMFGNDSSTYMRDQGNKRYGGKMRIVHGYFDKGANVVMAPFQFFEAYWKKVIARSTGANRLAYLNQLTKEGLPPLSENDKVIMEAIEQASDLYGFNYDNVPNWMHELSVNPVGKLTLPFKRYLYKHVKMLTGHLLASVNRNMPWQDRLARFMGLATFIGVIAAIVNANDDDRETPEKITTNTPRWMSPKGKTYAGKDENGKEKFLRTVKYPGFNLFAFTEGDITQGFMDMTEGSSSIGPLAQAILHQIGYKNDFEKYKETSQLHASTAASFIPGFRVLGDISQILDPFKKKTEDWKQEFMKFVPKSDPGEQDRLHGKIYVDKVPTGKNSTKDVQRKNYPEDTIKSMLTGIYTTRIDPDDVKAFEQRFEDNEEKKKEKGEFDAKKAEITDRYVKLYQESNEFKKGIIMERNMQVELYGKGKLTKSQIGQFNSVKEDFRFARSKDPFVKRLADFETNAERAEQIKLLKSGMENMAWRKYVGKLYEEGIISTELLKLIYSK